MSERATNTLSRRRIPPDYILYAPIGHFGVQNCTVVSRSDQQVDGVDASDHRPVVADIRFQTEEDLPENQE